MNRTATLTSSINGLPGWFVPLWCTVMPLNSFLLIPSVQGSVPAYMLAFASAFFVIMSRDGGESNVQRARYFRIALVVAGIWLLLFCGSQLGHLLSNRRDFGDLNLINPAAGKYYGQIAYGDDGGNASYNGLLLSLQHRFSSGFTALVNYTYSHCIADGDFSGDLRNTPYQNQFDRRADRGDCNFDLRQIFNASLVVKSPVKGSGVAGHLLGNWQIAPLVRAVTGVPVNITTGKDNGLSGEGNDRPNLNVGISPYNSSWGPSLQYLNSAAFALNPVGSFGNLGRDVIRYPGALNVDASVSRVFSITERFKVEARAEGFNIINHTNFTAYSNFGYGGLSSATSSTNFGQLTSAGDPRILQFALKMHF